MYFSKSWSVKGQPLYLSVILLVSKITQCISGSPKCLYAVSSGFLPLGTSYTSYNEASLKTLLLILTLFIKSVTSFLLPSPFISYNPFGKLEKYILESVRYSFFSHNFCFNKL